MAMLKQNKLPFAADDFLDQARDIARRQTLQSRGGAVNRQTDKFLATLS